MIINDSSSANCTQASLNTQNENCHDIHCASKISWSAIFGGAIAALGISLMLTCLSVGMGFNIMSYPIKTAATGLTFTVALWFLAQWIPSGVGGYIAGRWGKKNLNYSPIIGPRCNIFRSITHGFLTWAIATFFVATILTSTLTSLTGGAAKNFSMTVGKGIGEATKVAIKQHAEDNMDNSNINDYFVDILLRNPSNHQSGNKEVHSEIVGLIVSAIKSDDVNTEDKEYLAKIVSQKANISVKEASTRVDEIIGKIQAVKKAADDARKASECLFFFMFFAMLIGAIISCMAALMGGKKQCSATNHCKI